MKKSPSKLEGIFSLGRVIIYVGKVLSICGAKEFFMADAHPEPPPTFSANCVG